MNTDPGLLSNLRRRIWWLVVLTTHLHIWQWAWSLLVLLCTLEHWHRPLVMWQLIDRSKLSPIILWAVYAVVHDAVLRCSW